MSDSPRPRIVVAPDSFKGSLEAPEVAAAIASGLLRALPAASIVQCPLADGGEGTLDAMLQGARGERVMVCARDAEGRKREVPIGWFTSLAPGAAGGGAMPAGPAAVVESASIVALTDPLVQRVPIDQRSTMGIGDAIHAALERGARTVFVALGGSSTNDGGAGLLAALGVRLFDAAGAPLPATPAGLSRLAVVDLSQLDGRLTQTRLIALSDVDNPLTGPAGASAVFGPQKGAGDQVAALDAALARFADCLEAASGKRLREARGAGAAGGLGYALLMLGAEFRPGAEVVADLTGLDAALTGADWLISGEGRSDAQTLHGKTPFAAYQRAHRLGVPASLLSGAIDPDSLPALSEHFSGCFSAAPGPITLHTALADAPRLLMHAAWQMGLLWRAARGGST